MPGHGPDGTPMRRRLGRVLQLAGLLILPLAIAAELAGRVGLGQSLLIAACGAAVFLAGSHLAPPSAA
jgi:hypothetical protein